MALRIKLRELSERLGTEFHPGADANSREITVYSIATLQGARAGQISFLANMDYEKHLATCQASAVIVPKIYPECSFAQLSHPNPYLIFAKAMQLFTEPEDPISGISSLAFVDPSADLAADVAVGPFAYIGPHVKVGAGTLIYPGVYIGANAQVGSQVTIWPHVYVGHKVKIGNRVIIQAQAIIGSDGFGFAPGEGEIIKVPQIGTVVIEDDVEIGAATCIARAALETTLIKRWSKLDSHVHIAHNVVVGEQCMFAAFAGIAGSSQIGDRVLMGGHSGVGGHLKIASDTKILGMAGITNHTEQGQSYGGFPALPVAQWRRNHIHQRRLEQQSKKVKELEARLALLESKMDAESQQNIPGEHVGPSR